MKDDFKVRRATPPPSRTVSYRTAPVSSSRPVGADVSPSKVTLTPISTPASAPRAEAASPQSSRPSSPPPDHEVPATAPAPKTNGSKRRRQRSFRPLFSVLVTLIILGITGYVAADTWLSNNVVKKTTPSVAAVQGDSTEILEGSDENIVSVSAVDSYAVAADMPRVLTIDKINVRARILPMGVNSLSAIQAPVNIFDSGWYTGSAKPGEPGVSFIDAHASGATREGLFAYLDTLKAGDEMTVERGDGKVYKYAVRKLETQKLADINMAQVLSPQDGIKEGLTLMTCTGKWMADKATYDQRVIVYAERIE